MKQRTTLTIIAIIVVVLLFGVYAYKITKEFIRDITEKETQRITQEITEKEIARITEERTKQITEQILGGTTPGKKTECTLKPKPREFAHQSYYTGPLIDTHVHMPVASKIVSTVAMQAGFEDMPYEGDIPFDRIVCIFESEGIRKLFGFYLMPNIFLFPSVQSVKKVMEQYPEKMVPFFMPPPIQTLNPKPADAAKVLEENTGLFRGYGEVAFYMESFGGVAPDDAEFMQMYQLAKKHDLIAMIHPGPGHKPAVEKIVKENPEVQFLVHGDQEKVWILELMKKFPNVYYSVDAEITSIFGFDPKHQVKKPTKEEWLAYVRQNFDTVVDDAVREWKPVIETYPDRFLWGTDRWYGWQFEAEAGGLMEEIGRSFIGRLDPSVQEKFAYKNAERMLQK